MTVDLDTGSSVYMLGATPVVLFGTHVRGTAKVRNATNSGLKVFMDARSTVTAKEGDRYPLGPPEQIEVLF